MDRRDKILNMEISSPFSEWHDAEQTRIRTQKTFSAAAWTESSSSSSCFMMMTLILLLIFLCVRRKGKIEGSDVTILQLDTNRIFSSFINRFTLKITFSSSLSLHLLRERITLFPSFLFVICYFLSISSSSLFIHSHPVIHLTLGLTKNLFSKEITLWNMIHLVERVEKRVCMSAVPLLSFVGGKRRSGLMRLSEKSLWECFPWGRMKMIGWCQDGHCEKCAVYPSD